MILGDALYQKRLAFLMAMGLLLVAALNGLVMGLFQVNPIEQVVGAMGLILFHILVGIAALAVFMDRDTYLPFLGPTILPCSVLVDREPPGATESISIQVTPRAKVLYWAAEPSMDGLKSVKTWKEAYGTYEHAGVTTANAEGVAMLKIRGQPQPYEVPFKGKIESHIHYRVCGESGTMGRVQTTFLHRDVEGFESARNHRIQNLADTAASQY